MFRKAELEELRLRKDLLVLQCEANRLLLASEWERFRSPEFWRSEAIHSASKHPILTAALGVGGGILAIQMLRRPGTVIRWLGRLVGASPVLSLVWKLFGSGARGP